MMACFLTASCLLLFYRGPFSDRFGRRWTYNICTLVYIGTTLGCVFSPNIGVLIALRALQGFARECLSSYLGPGDGGQGAAFAYYYMVLVAGLCA